MHSDLVGFLSGAAHIRPADHPVCQQYTVGSAWAIIPEPECPAEGCIPATTTVSRCRATGTGQGIYPNGFERTSSTSRADLSVG